MKYNEFTFFIRSNPMDHAMIVGQIMHHCKRLIEHVLEASDLQTVATASLAIFDQMREVARTLLQAKVDLEAHKLRRQAVTPCCPGASLKYVHTRTVQPITLFGPITIPVRTFQCEGCGATQRPDDPALGVPPVGEFTDDIRCLYTPLVAEVPHRVASDIFVRFTGVALSSRGAQSLIDSSAADHRDWRQQAEKQEHATVAEVLAGADASHLRLEIAMDGVKAHIDGRWQEPKVATILVRRLPTRPKIPTRGAVLARRYVCVLGSAEELVGRIKAVIRDAGWESIPIAEILGDGAAWIWNVATAHFRGVRHTLDYYHLSEHLYTFAHLLYPDVPEQAKAWVEEKLAALLTDRVGDVLGALKRMRPRQPTVREGLQELRGYVENNRDRIHYKASWHQGLAVGSGSVEGACKHVIQARFKRAGMRWKQHGFLNVLELRLSRLNTTLEAFWASYGLKMPAVLCPTL
jgi:hypothetical protein